MIDNLKADQFEKLKSIARRAKHLCALMESDDRDFMKGERVGLIWTVEGELKRELDDLDL